MAAAGLDGRSVLLLESRRATELARLVRNFGGTPIEAPSLREEPLNTDAETLLAAEDIIAGRFDAVIFLTGVGARRIVDVVDRAGRREAFAAALNRTKVVSRGPKPMPVMRELGVRVWALAPEPNTWREVVATLDRRAAELPLAGAHLALQEYGGPSVELARALEARGATVTSLFVYRWTLPDDIEPMKSGIEAMCDGQVDVMLVTSAVQVTHLLQIAEAMGRAGDVRRRLASRVVIGSIGPTSSESLRRHGLEPDFEAAPPKMGVLVTELAARAASLLAAKRDASSASSSN